MSKFKSMKSLNSRQTYKGRREFTGRSIRKTRITKRFSNTFNRDLAAMKQVWEMLKKGTVTAIGEFGRQYH